MSNATASPALRLDGVTVTRGGRDTLRDVHWCVPAGTQAVLLGPNGSGKSTLLRILDGYLFPTRGTVDVLGERLGRCDVHRLRQRIGIVDPHWPYPPRDDLSVHELVLTGCFGTLSLDFREPTAEQIAAAGRALVDVGLGGQATQPIGTLSTGEGRRALLARALVRQPELLILDEPTAGLDLHGRETLLASLDSLVRRDPTLTVLLVTHHLEELPPTTQDVLLLGKGDRVANGRPEAVLTSEHLSAAFGCPVTVEQHDGRWQWRVAPRVWGQLLPGSSDGQ